LTKNYVKNVNCGLIFTDWILVSQKDTVGGILSKIKKREGWTATHVCSSIM